MRLEIAEEDNLTPWRKPLRRPGTLIIPDLPEKLDLVIGNEIYFEKNQLPPALKNQLVRLAASRGFFSQLEQFPSRIDVAAVKEVDLIHCSANKLRKVYKKIFGHVKGLQAAFLADQPVLNNQLAPT